MTLRTLNYGNYGIFLIMGHAGFCPSAVSSGWFFPPKTLHYLGTWTLRESERSIPSRPLQADAVYWPQVVGECLIVCFFGLFDMFEASWVS